MAAKVLVDQIQKLSLLNGRYSNLRWLNHLGGRLSSSCAVVFLATDNIENKEVVVKFFNPQLFRFVYEVKAFDREVEVLIDLISKKRCLQLVDGKSSFDMNISPTSAVAGTLPVPFIVVEHLPREVEDTFYKQDKISPRDKLLVFKQLLLSVISLHGSNIAHRDLKPDNMRAKSENEKNIVVLIDFGRATSKDKTHLKDVMAYSRHVGAAAYSAPEAHLGMSGIRDIILLDDIFALGCLLFELFNPDIFWVRIKSSPWEHAMSAMGIELAAATDETKMMEIWSAEFPKLSFSVSPPRIDGFGNSLPASIAPLINRAYLQMIQFDFRKRTTDLNRIVTIIDSAIKVIDNHRAEDIARKHKRILKQRYVEKLERKELRLRRYLDGRMVPK